MSRAAVCFDAALDSWVVTGWNEAREVLRADERFGVQAYTTIQSDLSLIKPFVLSPASVRRRLRRVMAAAFSAARIQQINAEVLRPAARALAAELPMDCEFDPVSRYLYPYQFLTITRLTGLTPDDAHELVGILRVAERSFSTEGPSSPAGHVAMEILDDRARVACSRAARVRTVSRLGLSEFARHEAPEAAQEGELPWLVAPFFATLAFKVGRDLPLTLLRHVALLHEEPQRVLRGAPGGLAAAADESVRLQPQLVVPRTALADTVLGGAAISKGARVLVMLGSANRDPAVFPRPGEFDPTRADLYGHLGFGSGPHGCVGKVLARALGVEAVGALLDCCRYAEWRGGMEGPPRIILHRRR